MRLTLVRHGQASAPEALGDEGRYLTRTGRDQVRATGEALRGEGVAPDGLLCSPLVRAVQTAELLAGALGYAGPIEPLYCLTPFGSLGELLAELDARPALSNVVLAGHEPFMSRAASQLLGLHVSGFATGAAYHLELAKLEPDGASLLFRFSQGSLLR